MFKKVLIIVFLQAAFGYLVLPEIFAGDIDAQGIYTKRCVICHGEDGSGQTDLGSGLGASDFSDKAVQDGITDEQIVEQIANGSDKMFPFKDNFLKKRFMLWFPS